MFSSKGKPEINHDEPVAFFATEEDWYVELKIRVCYTLLKTTCQDTSKLVHACTYKQTVYCKVNNCIA